MRDTPEDGQTVACRVDTRTFVAQYSEGDEWNKSGYYEVGEPVRHATVDAWNPIRFPAPEPECSHVWQGPFFSMEGVYHTCKQCGEKQWRDLYDLIK